MQDVSVCVKSDIGFKRRKNEDAYLMVYQNEAGFDVASFGRMFAVADGMGGTAGGDVASKTACEGLLAYYAGESETEMDVNPLEWRLGRLESVIWMIEKEICRLGEEVPNLADMGTTLSVLLLFQGHALIAHVGDSRVYRFRSGVMEQLTRDETMAQLSVEMGYLKPENLSGHPQGHVLTQALGAGLEKVNTRVERLESGDVFLLCSDGLYDMVPDKRILEIFQKSDGVEGVCQRLVEEALHNGGRDNVTVILVEVI